jgi:hypothetical protein
LKGGDETSKSGVKRKMGSKVKWREMKIVGEMCVLSFTYSYVALCMFCAVRWWNVCVCIICFCLFSSNYSTCVFLVFFVCFFSCFLFCMFCVFVLFCVLFLPMYIAVCTNFAQLYRPLLPRANPVAVNK